MERTEKIDFYECILIIDIFIIIAIIYSRFIKSNSG